MKHRETYANFGVTYDMDQSGACRMIESMVKACQPSLTKAHIVHRTMSDFYDSHPMRAYKQTLLVVDVHFQQSNRPSGRFMDVKKYFSGKHHDYGLKVETAHWPDGTIATYSPHHPGSKHDFQIFKDRVDEYRKLLVKTEAEKNIPDDGLIRIFTTIQFLKVFGCWKFEVAVVLKVWLRGRPRKGPWAYPRGRGKHLFWPSVPSWRGSWPTFLSSFWDLGLFALSVIEANPIHQQQISILPQVPWIFPPIHRHLCCCVWKERKSKSEWEMLIDVNECYFESIDLPLPFQLDIISNTALLKGFWSSLSIFFLLSSRFLTLISSRIFLTKPLVCCSSFFVSSRTVTADSRYPIARSKESVRS